MDDVKVGFYPVTDWDKGIADDVGEGGETVPYRPVVPHRSEVPSWADTLDDGFDVGPDGVYVAGVGAVRMTATIVPAEAA